MGLTQSSIDTKYTDENKYTDEQIKNRIQKIFFGNLNNNDNISAETLGWDQGIIDGGFTLSESSYSERFKNFDIRDVLARIQDGGNIDDMLSSLSMPQSEGISLSSEFRNIKQQLTDNKLSTNNTQPKSILDLVGGMSSMSNLVGGNLVGGNETSSVVPQDGDYSTTSNGNSDNINISPASSVTNSEADTNSEASYSHTNSNASPVSNSDAPVSESENTNTESSGLIIKPFSSTDTSEISFRHPYNKNRFN